MNKHVKKIIETFEQVLKEYDPKTAAFDFIDDYEISYKEIEELVKFVKEKESESNE